MQIIYLCTQTLRVHILKEVFEIFKNISAGRKAAAIHFVAIVV